MLQIRKSGVYAKKSDIRRPAARSIPRSLARQAVEEGFAIWVNRYRDIQLVHEAFPFRGDSCSMSAAVMDLIVSGSPEHVAIFDPPVEAFVPPPEVIIPKARQFVNGQRIAYSI
jgi:hypothetical protein